MDVTQEVENNIEEFEPLEIELPEVNPLLGEDAYTKTSLSVLCMNDLQSSFFSISEKSENKIDIEKSFTPSPRWRTILVRIIFSSFTFSVSVYSFASTYVKITWFEYLTHWSAIFTSMYFIPILVCSLKPSLLYQPEASEYPAVITRFIWIMYTVSTVAEITITFLYWKLVRHPGEPIKFVEVALHGIFGVLLVFDGAVIGKIPVRLKHILFIELVSILYIAWSLIHCLVLTNGPLYDVLDWKDDPIFATVVSAATILILVPFVFMFIWMLSHSFCLGGRRYTVPDNEQCA